MALQNAELETQHAQLAQQRYLIVAVTGGFLLSLVFLIIYFSLNKKNKYLSERNATLVREVNHRVKNNLQVLSSLLSLQSRRLSDPKAKVAIEESQLRVSSMAFIHRRLYGDQLKEIPVPDYVGELVSHATESYGFTQEQLQTDLQLPDTLFDVDTMVPLGLIINELVSNACKYAFSDHFQPVLRVQLVQLKEQWQLTVQDNGPGLPEELLKQHHRTNSFGMKLVQLQAKQLEGTVTFENQQGLVARLNFKSMF